MRCRIKLGRWAKGQKSPILWMLVRDDSIHEEIWNWMLRICLLVVWMILCKKELFMISTELTNVEVMIEGGCEQMPGTESVLVMVPLGKV